MFKKRYLKIEIKQPITAEYSEKLEDLLSKFFTKEMLAVSIFDSVTGNTTVNYVIKLLK